MNEEVKVSLQLMNGILQYLGTKPYGEVFQIVNAIHAEVQPQIPMPEMAREAANAPPMLPKENMLVNDVFIAPVGLPATFFVPPPLVGTSYS